MPSFGSAVERTFDEGTHLNCSTATSNTAGQVALGFAGAFSQGAGTAFDLYTSTGTPQGAQLGPVMVVDPPVIDPWFHPTSGGYQGILHDPGVEPPVVLRTWDAAGTQLRDSARLAVSSAPTAAGGSIVLAQDFDVDAGATGATHLDWTDAAGQVTQTVALDRAPNMVLEAWSTQHVFVLDTKASPWAARWFDGAGAALTPWFTVSATPQGHGPYLQLLADGTTVALSDGAAWRALLHDGVASADAVPDWLSARPNTRLAKIRQARGYVTLSWGDNADATKLEVLTTSGESCGTAAVPAPAPPNGQTWTPRRLDVGQDGTVFQTVGRTGGGLDASIHCAFRWWPALLR